MLLPGQSFQWYCRQDADSDQWIEKMRTLTDSRLEISMVAEVASAQANQGSDGPVSYLIEGLEVLTNERKLVKGWRLCYGRLVKRLQRNKESAPEAGLLKDG